MIHFFKNPTFRFAMMMAVLWHAFWFFGLSVDISMPTKASRKTMNVTFVGPVLSDDAFNMIIASKPELSHSFYRAENQIAQNLEPEAATLQRHNPGDLISMPLGQSTWSSLQGLIQDEKPYANTDFQDKLTIDFVKAPFLISGPLKKRDIFQIPDKPKAQVRLDGVEMAPTLPEFELIVNAAGDVTQADIIISSGDPEIDLKWQRYLKKWQFMPQESAALVKGFVKITS